MTARAKATTASIQDPRPLSDRGHHPVLSLLNVPGGIRLHRGPIRGGVVRRVCLSPGLGTCIAQDPDELLFLIDRQAPMISKPWRRRSGALSRVHSSSQAASSPGLIV